MSWQSKIEHKFIGDITYRAVEVPGIYYVLKSTGLNDGEKVDSIYQKVKDERVIEFEFEHSKNEDLLNSDFTGMSYTSSVRYMSFSIADDFKIATSTGDTISCAGVNFERNYKLAPFKRILVHFQGIPPDEEIKLIYNDRLYKAGKLIFDFEELPTQL